MSDDRPSFGQALSDAGISDSGGFDSPAETTPAEDSVSASSAEALATDGPPVAAPTAPPDGGEPSSTPAKGPIPFDRHEAILKNARDEAAALKADYEAKLQALSWAQDVPTEHAAAVAALVQQSGGDPVQFLLGFGDRLLQNPEHAAALKSAGARWMSRRDPAAAVAAAQPAGPPKPTTVMDGFALFTEADLAARDQYLLQQVVDAVTGTVGEQFADVSTLAKQLKEARDEQARLEAATGSAKAVFEKASKWRGFEQHKALLAEKLVEAQKQPGYNDDRVGETLQDLYIEHVVPLLESSSQKTLLRDLKTQALTGPSPASAPPAAVHANGRPTFAEWFAQNR